MSRCSARTFTVPLAWVLTASVMASSCMPGGGPADDPVSAGRSSGGAPAPAAGGSGGTGGIPPATGSGGSSTASSGGAAGPSAASGGASGQGAGPPSSTGGAAGSSSPADTAAPNETSAPAEPGMVADPGSEGDGSSTMNAPYNPPPEATLMAGVTAGKLIEVPVQGTIFASRTVQVYIPHGYVERTAAPFMVLQDGPSYVARFKLNTVLDNMIAKKQLPLMLAIFVPNGGGRRSVEYDTLSDAYVRFILDEVLPAVEKTAPVKLTTDPEGRSAGGHSSGGIAAFTMGWHRPDQFRRILTHSGSFVSIRGGDKYPDVVKAMPKKPLRVFLSVGTRDNEPPRWQRGNENMAAALKQQGYHHRLVIQNEGTHAQTYPASILPETLLWLWRGYPIAR